MNKHYFTNKNYKLLTDKSISRIKNKIIKFIKLEYKIKMK